MSETFTHAMKAVIRREREKHMTLEQAMSECEPLFRELMTDERTQRDGRKW